MEYDAYIGHDSQVCCVEEVRLIGGRGGGMRLLQVRNADGLELTISIDRCADISRLIYKGHNMGYFSPCGYVSPAYYDDKGTGFLKNFTAGFLTTCGLTGAGAACTDGDEDVPMHGTISNAPCDRIWWSEDADSISIHAQIRDGRLFGHKLLLHRQITCRKRDSCFAITDTVSNQGDTKVPLMLMYHMNIGYPLLSEQAVVHIPSRKVVPRDARAAEGLDVWDRMESPTPGYAEQCYYHCFEREGSASVYNPTIRKGLVIRFDTSELPCFTEWKMMGIRDYALGLEPGNCTPDGRDVLRREGRLAFLPPREMAVFRIRIELFER